MRNPTIRRFAPRAAAALFGVGLLGYLIWRIGPANVFDRISALGWGLAPIVALGGVVHLAKTWAWRFTLTESNESVSFLRLLQLRLASEAVGQIGAFGQVFGDGLRVSAMGPKIPIDTRVSSVTRDRALFILSSALVSLAGISAALVAMPLSRALRVYTLLFAAGLLGLLVAAVAAVLNRWSFVSGPARLLGRLRFLRNRVEGGLPLIRSVEQKLYDFHRNTPAAFWASLLLNLVCHCMAVLEVYLILLMMGFKISLLSALVIEALTKLVNAFGALIPGNVGTYEGGNVLIAAMFGLTGAAGLSVALSRRLRAIFWTVVGGICLFLLSRPGPSANSDETRPSGSSESRASVAKDERAIRPFTTVILTNAFGAPGTVCPELLCVGTLPILLRAILSIQRVVAGRVFVCIDRAARGRAQHELLSTGRLPTSVEWLESSCDLPVSELLEQVLSAAGEDRLMLVAGNRTYSPALFRRVREWSEDGAALALTTDCKPVGILLLPEMARDAAKHCPREIRDFDRFHAWLSANRDVECKDVSEEMWQVVLTAQDISEAERKLNRWLIKPTDGFFAQMNRRISVPISRRLIAFPITPNMVSIFTLGVGILSGLFFARGGYWNTIAGAILSLWASILDGCDGEVARLKLLESDFGCWLETVCDYLYYLIVFTGMAIGLMRSSGSRGYLIWGAVLLTGAILSFIVAGLGRLRLAAGRPEQYLRIWQKRAENRRSNPILYIGRHTEFLIRRCFLPYALLGFALLNITQVAFFLTAIGANLAWVVSLYSFCNFAPPGRSSIADPAVSAETSA